MDYIKWIIGALFCVVFAALCFGIGGVLAWREERAKRRQTAEEQVRRHEGT